MQIAVDLPNENVAEKVLWFLEHLKNEGVRVFKNKEINFLDIEEIKKDDADYQIILRGRKERTTHPENYGTLDDIDWD